MTVCFAPSAMAVFEAAVDYYLAANPIAAERFRDRVLRSLSHLERFPLLGHPIPEFPDEPFREVIVDPYRFFYFVEDDSVWIVGVWHGAQQAGPPQRPAP